MPAALVKKPDLLHWMPKYVRAFDLLSSRREYGMGPNPINLLSIECYIRMFEVDDVEDFVTMICAMDMEFLLFQCKKSDAKKPKEKK
jgi:hypothetical protein